MRGDRLTPCERPASRINEANSSKSQFREMGRHVVAADSFGARLHFRNYFQGYRCDDKARSVPWLYPYLRFTTKNTFLKTQ